jgi:hypothetical protein
MTKSNFFRIGIAVIAVLALFGMAGCDSVDPAPNVTYYEVTFQSNNDNDTLETQTVAAGSKLAKPDDPAYGDNFFGGWYRDYSRDEETGEETFGTLWDFENDTVTRNIILTAQWLSAGGTQDARLDSIKLNGTDLDTEEGCSKGTPNALLDYVTEGIYESAELQPASGTAIVITAKNTDATVKWLVKDSKPTAADFTNAESPSESPLEIKSNEKLYIQVTSQDEEKVLYYIIRLYYLVEETINYGQPVINGETLDPLWESNYNGPIFDISRPNKNEMTPNFKFLNTVDGAPGHTQGTAKAYWDDSGLYVYATITFHDYYANASDKANNKKTVRKTHMRGNYESDSFEIMTNLRRQKVTQESYEFCQQFRVGFSNGDEGQINNTFPSKSGSDKLFVIGGNNRPTDFLAADNIRPLAAFRQSGEFYAWITYENGKETGYKVLAKVPWYIIGQDGTSDVFDQTTGMVKNNAVIGMDLQINCATDPDNQNPARDAILTCSSLSTQALTDARKHAKITLAPPTNPSTRVVKAHAPTIRTQPWEDGGKISVDAVVGPLWPAPAALAYQWYSAVSATAAGTIVSGATDATYASPVSGVYYYVEVTNTNNAAIVKTASVISNRYQWP